MDLYYENEKNRDGGKTEGTSFCGRWIPGTQFYSQHPAIGHEAHGPVHSARL